MPRLALNPAMQAPYHIDPAVGPFTVAAQMTALFAALEQAPQAASDCYAHLIPVPSASATALALRSAGQALARDIDAGIGAGAANGYHNRQHFCEVWLSALALGRLAGLAEEALLTVLFAALAHDFHHDGRRNGAQPFRLEQMAADAAQPYLAAAGVPAPVQEKVCVLILSTEVAYGVPYARQCHVQQQQGAAVAAPAPVAARLTALAADADLARLAVLLAEADLLPSVGLTIAHSERCQQRLSAEWQLPTMPVADQLHFVEQQVRGFLAGTFFTPNLHRLRDHLRAGLVA